MHHLDIECKNEGHCDTNVGWRARDNRPNFGSGIQEPPQKDTVIVPVGGYVVIRFRADNPGWWFLHCHIEPHQLEGMSMVVREGTLPPPPDSFPKCGNFEITTYPTSGFYPMPLSFSIAVLLVVFVFIINNIFYCSWW